MTPIIIQQRTVLSHLSSFIPETGETVTEKKEINPLSIDIVI